MGGSLDRVEVSGIKCYADGATSNCLQSSRLGCRHDFIRLIPRLERRIPIRIQMIELTSVSLVRNTPLYKGDNEKDKKSEPMLHEYNNNVLNPRFSSDDVIVLSVISNQCWIRFIAYRQGILRPRRSGLLLSCCSCCSCFRTRSRPSLIPSISLLLLGATRLAQAGATLWAQAVSGRICQVPS